MPSLKRQYAVKSRKRATERSPAGDALSALINQVMRLQGLLTASSEILAACAGQTSARWRVLLVIEETPATVAEIARALGLSRQAVQRVADLLEKSGEAAYLANPAHQRAKLLRLTPHGRETLDQIKIYEEPWSNNVAAQIGEEALRRATQTLGRVLQAVEQYDFDQHFDH